MSPPTRAPKSAIRRRPHHKSRAGCLVCKARKVKCDEQFPACANCIKRGAECDYGQRGIATDDCRTDIEKPPSLNLELLHHFCISTAYTLSTEPIVHDFWRVVVPKLALSGVSYLLDGILALAALHKARDDPSRRDELLYYAMHYHSESLAKGWPLVSTLTPKNGSSLYIFAVLAIHFSLGRPRDAGEMLLGENGAMVELLHLLHGAHLIRESLRDIETSPASLIFQTTETSFDFWCTHNPDYHPALVELNHKIAARNPDNDCKRNILQSVVMLLGRSYTFMDNPAFKEHDRFRGFYSWLYNAGEAFWILLGEGSDEAMCVLAFYLVLVSKVESSWWLEGWSNRLIREIHGLLKDEFKPWIAFPMERIGWTPNRAQQKEARV